MKITCPKNPEHRQFHVTAHVAEIWLTDENGEWLETMEEAGDVVHQPDREDQWNCAECGEDAEVTD